MASATESDSLEGLINFSTYSQSLASLVNSLTHRDDDEEEGVRYGAILLTLGLSGNKDEKIDLATFRRVIAKHLIVDGSFMFKRVFNAFDRVRKGYLTGEELVAAISILLRGPFQEHVKLGMRVYGKPIPVNPEENPEVVDKPHDYIPPTSTYAITRLDAIHSIVESLQLSSPRARHTLTTDNRDKAFHIGEDLVFIIYPKVDLDGDGIVSLQDFTKACHEDPTLVQVFGQFLPRNLDVLPTPPPTPPKGDEFAKSASLERPKSSTSRTSFEGINYLQHSPTMKQLWYRSQVEPGHSSIRLEPIPVRSSSKIQDCNELN